jgi:hypothetical protein
MPPLPPECFELHETIASVPPDRGYPHPTELVRSTLINLAPVGDPTTHAAFTHLYSLLTTQVPYIELLRDICHVSGQRWFTEWADRHNRLFYPVLDVLHTVDRRGFSWEKSTKDRMHNLTTHIIYSLSDSVEYSQRPSRKMEAQTEKLIALTLAHMCNARDVFPYSPMRTPDHAARHWTKIIRGELRECLLDHGHDVNKMMNVLSDDRVFRTGSELCSMIHLSVPALVGGAL